MEDYTDLQDFVRDVQELRQFRPTTGGIPYNMRKTRKNPLRDLTNAEFLERYRFSKTNMRRIIEVLKEDLLMDKRGGSIPFELQVMAVIRYFGKHETQEVCGEMHGIGQQTLSYIVRKIASALASKSSIYIKMPNPTEETNVISKFEAISGLKGVLGAVGCMETKIIRLVEGNQYISGNFFINTQIVCDADQKICDIECQANTDDGTLWQNSIIRNRFENREFSGGLITDSSCLPYSPHLIIPVTGVTTQEEQQFNESHIQTYKIFNTCLDRLKGQYKIVEEMGGDMAIMQTNIIACAVLHNMAILWRDEQELEEGSSSDSTVNGNVVVMWY